MKGRFVICLVVILIVCLINPIPSTAQSPITILQDQVVSAFPDELTFQLSASSASEISKIYLLYRTNAVICQSSDARQEIEFDPSRNVSAAWDWDFTLTGILPPGAEIYWQWEIHDADGNSLLTDEQTFLVNDPRHTWSLLKRGQVNVQWYVGSWTFGQTLADLADQALERLSSKAGIRPTGTIWLTIYPSVEELKLVDIHTTEWAGGLAYTEYNSSIIAIGTDELAWAAYAIPHELAHLVTEAVMFNCKGRWLPTWLNEGLSTVSLGEIPQGYIDNVTTALDHKKLPPLRTLEAGFSSDAEEANLSYGQSGMVVTYLLDQYGSQKMTDLMEAVKSGLRIDKALVSVFGMDTDGIDAKWRVSLGYEPQATLVPTSSSKTTVPTLALWTSAIRPTITPTIMPSSTPQTLPTDTFTSIPSPTASPMMAAETVGAVDPPGNDPSTPGIFLYLVIGIIFTIILVAVPLIILKNKRSKRI